MTKIVKTIKFLLTYISILLGITAIYIYFEYGRISMEQVFFIDDSILNIPWVKKIILIIITTSLVLTFIVLLLPLKKLKLISSLISISFFVFVFSLYEYIRYNISYSDFYEKEYKTVSPKDISFPKNKRNLIVIYLESLEQSYDGKNVKPYLDSLQKSNINFSGFKQLESANYTISAQFAGLCGLPLKKVSSVSDLMNFMPSVICVPDILKNAGYNLTYLKAADIKFSGAGAFAKQHSFDNIKGYKELAPILKEKFKKIDGNSFGGLRDKMLFEAAKIELKEMQQPFMLSLTTLDTHDFPKYFVDETCQKNFGDIRDAVHCLDDNIKQFMEWLQQQDFFADTTVVLIGDHVGNNGLNSLSDKPVIYNAIINPTENLVPEKHNWTTYDLAPTILNSIGIDISYLGIGRSLFKKEQTLLEKYANNFNFMLMSKNQMYNEFNNQFDLKYSFKPYSLGKVLTNRQIAEYSDIGRETFCYSTTIMSLSLGKEIPDNIELETNILSLAETFDILLNGHIIFSNKKHHPQKQKLIIPLKKEWIKNGGNILIEVSITENDRNFTKGICFDNFVLKQAQNK